MPGQRLFDGTRPMWLPAQACKSCRVEPLLYARTGRAGPELTSCNIYFVLRLDKDAGERLP
jgi:hypothetical protein